MSNSTQRKLYVNYRKNGCQYITGNGDMIMQYRGYIVRKDRLTGRIRIITEEMMHLGARAIDEHPDINITCEEFEVLIQKGIIT